MAVVVCNCWRGERKTAIRRALTAEANADRIFYSGRPPEHSEPERIFHQAVVSGMLGRAVRELPQSDRKALVEAVLLHYGQEIPLNETHRELRRGARITILRATLHRRIPAVMQCIRRCAAG